MTAVLVFVAMLVAVVATLVACSVRILREYERAVVFRLGRLLVDGDADALSRQPCGACADGEHGDPDAGALE